VERKAKRRQRDRIKLALTLVAGAVIGMGITIFVQ
jgi:F0F1-type ATP synthase assembly protein I